MATLHNAVLRKGDTIRFSAAIEGLRGWAVILVVLYHIGFPFVTGGFVGVDVFFVISGFLMAKAILERLAAGSFSMTGYMFSRVFRIVPALSVTALLTYGFSVAVMSPSVQADVHASLPSVISFTSNIFFSENSGYFDQSAVQRPFLHTWSLGVEAQFYLFAPVLLYAVYRFRTKSWSRWLIACIAIASLSFCEYQLRSDHSVNAYFSVFTRLWEFVFGISAYIATQAMRRPKPSDFSKRDNQVASFLTVTAVIGLVVSATTLSKTSVFPGLSALIPCACAAILIGVHPTRTSQLLLCNSVVRYFGKISYSLYLVHWPVIVFASYLTFGHLSVGAWLIVGFLMLLLAQALYSAVEAPKSNKGRLIGASYAALLTLCFVTFAFVPDSPSAPKAWLDPLHAGIDLNRQRALCQNKEVSGYHICFFGTPVSVDRPNVDVVLMGDSHAWHWLSGLDVVLRERGLVGAKINQAGGTLPSAVGATYDGAIPKPRTDKYFKLLDELKPRWVVFSARWDLYANARETNGVAANRQVIKGLYEEESRAAESFRYAMEQTIAKVRARGFEVIVIGQVPEFGISPVDCLTRPAYLHDIFDYRLCEGNPRDVAVAHADVSRTFFSHLHEEGKIRFMDMIGTLCPSGVDRCTYFDGSVSLYKDSNHLTYDGAVLLARRYLGGAFPSSERIE